MVSPFIQNIKDWKIREVVTGFLEAKALFEENMIYQTADEYISFKVLFKVCDILFETKENYHLIFEKIKDPRKRTFESTNKFIPGEDDINFMNNIGLLFHKVMVARELRYIFDYYQEDSAGYQETKAALERNLFRIKWLFNEGINILLKMLQSHAKNIYLITYFLENDEFCSKQFDMRMELLLKLLTKEEKLEDAYILAAKYYIESGWYDKSREICQKCLTVQPNNVSARDILEGIEKRT